MKNNKLKSVNYQSEDMKEIKTLVIITIVIVVFAVGLYFLTDLSLARKNKNNETGEAVISYTETTIGTMFTRPYDEYYVFAYNSKADNAKDYETLFDKYNDKEDAKKIYYVDLSSKFNSSVLSETSNKKPETVNDVKIKDVALILIKNGKVSKYYETISEFEKALN